MFYYKDKTNGVHCLDSETFTYLLPEGSVEITKAEADALRAPPPPKEKTAEEIIAENASAKKLLRQNKALEVLPDILAYIAAKADAPVALKGKAAELVAMKVAI